MAMGEEPGALSGRSMPMIRSSWLALVLVALAGTTPAAEKGTEGWPLASNDEAWKQLPKTLVFSPLSLAPPALKGAGTGPPEPSRRAPVVSGGRP